MTAGGLKQQVDRAFNEPDCAINRDKDAKARKRGCGGASLAPGAAAGGCAFDGAKIALQPITDVVHLVHGPIACEGNSWDSRNVGSSGPQLYRTAFTTDLGEFDVIHGGEKRLYRAIREAVRRFQPPAVFVYVTCVPALTGDDVEAVCQAAGERLGLPVVPVMAPGFVGSKNLGNKLAGQVLIERVIGSREPEAPTVYDVNLLGEYNVAGELDEIRRLFARVGITLVTAVTGDARYATVCTAHRSRVNMVVCSQAMVSLARAMRARWDIPYFEGSFYGVGETSTALRTLARVLVERGAPAELLERAEEVIAEETARAEQALAPLRDRLRGKRVLLYTGGVKSWSMVSALQELDLVLVGTSVRKSTEEDKARIAALLDGEERMVGQIPAKELYRMLAAGEADILLSGGRTQFMALKTMTPWLDVNQERHHAFAGYSGAVTLATRIAAALANPIWAQVRRPAPWTLRKPRHVSSLRRI